MYLALIKELKEMGEEGRRKTGTGRTATDSRRKITYRDQRFTQRTEIITA